MTYNVLVRNNPNGRYEATILGWPDCTVEGSSRQDVVQRARELLTDLLAEWELIQVEIEAPSPKSPLLQFAGMWAEDETFEEFVDAMESYRCRVNADENQP